MKKLENLEVLYFRGQSGVPFAMLYAVTARILDDNQETIELALFDEGGIDQLIDNLHEMKERLVEMKGEYGGEPKASQENSQDAPGRKDAPEEGVSSDEGREKRQEAVQELPDSSTNQAG